MAQPFLTSIISEKTKKGDSFTQNRRSIYMQLSKNVCAIASMPTGMCEGVGN